MGVLAVPTDLGRTYPPYTHKWFQVIYKFLKLDLPTFSHMPNTPSRPFQLTCPAQFGNQTHLLSRLEMSQEPPASTFTQRLGHTYHTHTHTNHT